MFSRVAVIGSGPSGLAAAVRLQQAGCEVHIFEASDRIGGKLRTASRDGFTFEEGAIMMPSAYRDLLALIDVAGLSDRLRAAGSVVGFARGSDLHYLDSSRLYLDAARTKLLSARSKLSMLKVVRDDLRIRRHLNYEDLSGTAPFDVETAAEYARRRGLPDEVMDLVIDASVRAMTGSGADEVSTVDFFFAFDKMLGTKTLTLAGGMGTYPDALAERFEATLGRAVSLVEQADSGIRVDGVEFDGCVLAVPGTVVADVCPWLDPESGSFLRALRYTHSVSVNLALSRPPRTAKPAFLVQVPRSVHPGIICMFLEHNRVPDRLPAGAGMLNVFTTSDWARGLFADTDEEVVAEVVAGVERVLPDVGRLVEWGTVHRWYPTAIVTHPGYYGELVRFRESRRADTTVQIAGDFYSIGNLNSATVSGDRAAARLLQQLG